MATVRKPLRLAKLLKAYRWKHEIGQREIARQIGVSVSTYCRFEQGQDMDGKSTRAIIMWVLGEDPPETHAQDDTPATGARHGGSGT